jgi:hypothetical protein
VSHMPTECGRKHQHAILIQKSVSLPGHCKALCSQYLELSNIW